LKYCSTERILQDAAGRISFTADIWSDSNRRGYLAITSHWIARDKATQRLELKRALLAFHRLHGSHDGKSMAEAALHLLDRAGITAKVRLLFDCYLIKGLMDL
jgi:hypothetical protein